MTSYGAKIGGLGDAPRYANRRVPCIRGAGMTTRAAKPTLVHQPGLTVLTVDGVRIGLIVGSGAAALAYTMPDLRLLGSFDTMDAAVAEIATALVAEAQRTGGTG